MYLPPLCLDVLKDELTRLFEPTRVMRKNKDSSLVENRLFRAERIVGAARCAASLALCGNAQLSELARCLCDRVVDPGYASAADAERDLEERGEHLARLPVRPHIKALIAGIGRQQRETGSSTIALSDAMFVYRLPFDAIPMEEGVDISSCLRSMRVPEGEMINYALEKAVIAAVEWRGRGARALAEARAASARDVCISDLVRELLPDVPPENVANCLVMLKESGDPKVATAIDRYAAGVQNSLPHVRRTLQAAVAAMERAHALNDALAAAGLLPWDASLYEEYVEGGNPRALTVDRVVASTLFEKVGVDRPVLFANTRFGASIWSALTRLWDQDVHGVVMRSESAAEAATVLSGMRDRLSALVKAIDEDTIPTAPDVRTLPDLLKLPRGSKAHLAISTTHVASSLDQSVVYGVLNPPNAPYPSAFALMEKFASVVADFRKEQTRSAVHFGSLSITDMRSVISRIDSLCYHYGNYYSMITCPLCGPRRMKTFGSSGLFTHIILSHWQPFLHHDGVVGGGVGPDEGGPRGPTSSGRHCTPHNPVAKAKA
jgi:hypothetical protein